MGRSPLFAASVIDTWLTSVPSGFARIALLCFAGGLGGSIGLLCSMEHMDGAVFAFTLIGYPVFLLLGLVEPLGVATWGVFFVLALGIFFFDIRVKHAFGLLLPLQAITSFAWNDGAGWGPCLLLFAVLLPIVIIYALSFRVSSTGLAAPGGSHRDG